jgi:hypothetical protein
VALARVRLIVSLSRAAGADRDSWLAGMNEDAYQPKGRLDRIRGAARDRGVGPVAVELARGGVGAFAGLPWLVRGAHGRFELDGQGYAYLCRRYNVTWLNERAIEVPVVQAIVDRYEGERVLEVGNVLSHYRTQRHLVLDKYEKAPGVVNRDVVDPGDLGPFELIVSISTLEHVGWDEQPRDPEKAARAVAALTQLLAPGGQLVLTVPLGWNQTFEAALRDGQIPVTRFLAVRRFRAGPHWRELPAAQAFGIPYDFLIGSAGAVLFAFIAREDG